MYADDTVLYDRIDDFNKDNSDCEISHELEHISHWLTANKLSLNVKSQSLCYFTN